MELNRNPNGKKHLEQIWNTHKFSHYPKYIIIIVFQNDHRNPSPMTLKQSKLTRIIYIYI